MKDNICVTTFVFGEKYQGYLPILLYSLKKAYPAYVPIIFIHGKLRNEIRIVLQDLEQLGKFIIKEDYYNKIGKLGIVQGKALRWVLRDQLFLEYDYLYFVDIDILYFKETPSLHEQHIQHMDMLNTPYSNVRRSKITYNATKKVIKSRIKEFGITNAVINLLKGTVKENRLTGLHFVKTKEYFSQVKEIQEKYEKLLFSNKYLNYFQGNTCEAILFQICYESGLKVEDIGYYSDKYSLDFTNYKEKNFRPHHGIHLGLFRNKKYTDNVNETVTKSATYKYYISQLDEYLEDDFFLQILKKSDDFILDHFICLFKYYNIDYKF
jgi:hypothetical protein